MTLANSDQPLSELYDVALLDLDGVIYLGDRLITNVSEVLEHISMRLAFVTNNASRTPAQTAERLAALGLNGVDPTHVVTSAQAAGRLVAERLEPGDAVLVTGGDGLVQAIEEHGLTVVHSADDEPKVVVQGFSPDLNWSMLAEATVAVSNGVPWITANLDPTLPTTRGRLPGNGSFVQMISNITGAEPIVAGKPQRHLFDETVVRENAQRPLVVGDRLDTDIEGAINAGLDSLLVMTGVTTIEHVARSEIRPTYISADLRGLLDTHEPVHVDGDHARCAGAEVFHEFGVFKIADPQAPLTPLLRAITGLAWHYIDRGGDFMDLGAVEAVVGGRIKP